MKHKKETQGQDVRRSAGLIVLLAVIVIAAIICIVVRLRETPDKGEQPPAATPAVEHSSSVGTETQEEILVETPFGTLRYPGKWRDQVRIETADLGYGYAVHFYADFGDDEAELFAVMFGFHSDSSTCVGAITSNGITTSVNTETPKWTKSHSDRAKEMQADLQYLLDKLAEDPFFSTETDGVSDAVIPQTPKLDQK